LFSQSVHLVVGDEKILVFERIRGWGIDSYALCFTVYFNCLLSRLISSILSVLESQLSPFVGFCRLLTNKETTNVLALLAMIGDFCFRPNKGILVFGALLHPNAFLVALFSFLILSFPDEQF